MNKELISTCLNNWLGYGKINSPFWFLGIEEGGAETTRCHLSIEQSLSIRCNFKLTEDFYDVWVNRYGCDLEMILRKPTTWRFISAFLLAINSQEISNESIKKFIIQDKLLGTLHNKSGVNQISHFMCEFYPLPKESLANWSTEFIPLYSDQAAYYKGEKEKRSALFLAEIDMSDQLKLIVCYKTDILSILQQHSFIKEYEYQSNNVRKQTFKLYSVKTKLKEIKLLVTPFFGTGRISYKGINFIVRELLNDRYI